MTEKSIFETEASTRQKPKAIVLTDGFLADPSAKTAHGLIRGTERFTIAGVIDPPTAGRDAGEVLDGRARGIPVFADVPAALAQLGAVEYCIIGVATHGGYLPPVMLDTLKAAIQNGISIVNGLHEFLNDKPDMVELAARHGATLTDVRRPKNKKDLHFWTGEIYTVAAPVVAVLGTDCAMGKRTAARMLVQACRAEGLNAHMIYTGQTGWMQGGQYGFVFDSTLNDFISGELEHAAVSCYRETGAELIFLEGQSALFNPSGPCGAEYLLSGNAKHVVLVHAPKRIYFDHDPKWGEIPSIEKHRQLLELYGAQLIGLALNTEHCTREEAFEFQRAYRERLGVPVLLPLEEGVGDLVPVLRGVIRAGV
jgi:uncharacterized NAD-dependent epimerase/dehydratase family protein